MSVKVRTLNVTLNANQMQVGSMFAAQLSRCVAVYSRHFVASRINAPAVVVAVVFTLDHIVTTKTTMGWTKSLLYRCHSATDARVRLRLQNGPGKSVCL